MPETAIEVAAKKPDTGKLAFDEIAGWASDNSFTLNKRMGELVGELVQSGDVKLKLFAVALGRRKAALIAKMLERFEKVGEKLFTDENIEKFDADKLAQLYAMLSSDILKHGDSLKQTSQVTLEGLVDALTKGVAAQASQGGPQLSPEGREAVRAALIGFKNMAKHEAHPKLAKKEKQKQEIDKGIELPAELVTDAPPQLPVLDPADPPLIGPPPIL